MRNYCCPRCYKEPGKHSRGEYNHKCDNEPMPIAAKDASAHDAGTMIPWTGPAPTHGVPAPPPPPAGASTGMPPPGGTSAGVPPQETMLMVGNQLITPTLAIQQQHQQLEDMRKQIAALNAEHRAPKRWHPNDNRQPYTWDEFYAEAKSQLKKTHKGKNPSHKDIMTKTHDMWNLATPDRAS